MTQRMPEPEVQVECESIYSVKKHETGDFSLQTMPLMDIPSPKMLKPFNFTGFMLLFQRYHLKI